MEKKNKLIIALIIIILLLLLLILYILFSGDKSFTITFDTNGGTEISEVEVKNNEIVKLPNEPVKEGYKFIGWTNEEGKVITKGTKVTKDITLKANWISKDAKTVTAKFNTDGGNEIDDISLEKNKTILLPINPTKEGYVFVGWKDKDGKIISENMIVTKGITLTAVWVEKGANIKTITFNTDGGSNIENIVVEDGKVILLPVNPTKEGYVFAGWIDENGNAVTKDTVITNDMTIKALWKEPYTCPDDCKPIGNGSKCTKEVTTKMISQTSCPSGYKMIEGQCLDVKNQYHAQSIDQSPWWACNSSSEYMYTEIDESGMGAMMWCAKKTNKVTTKVCPSGYTQSKDICKKTETINCKAN